MRREITNANATWGTIRRTVNCPYCGTGFTFRSEERFTAWKEAGRKDPLHPLCIKAAKEQENGN